MQTKLLFFSLIMGSALLSSCQDNDEIQLPKDSTNKVSTEISNFMVSPEEAKQSVVDFMTDSERKSRATGDFSREVDSVLDLSTLPKTRSTTPFVDGVGKDFYVVTFKKGKGYAFVSKDKRTFPIFAILDKGDFSLENFEDQDYQTQIAFLQEGKAKEIVEYTEAQDSLRATRSIADGDLTPIEDHKRDGWKLERRADARTETTWGQHIVNAEKYLNSQGAPYKDVYSIVTTSVKSTIDQNSATHFGCTPVAYAQVMYALRNCEGFKDLKYSSGEPVLWHRMNPKSSLVSPEVQRFIGWITTNCSPTYFKNGTMVYNTKAKDFMRRIVGKYIHSRYDNCVVGEGDFDGYGWSESRRVAEEFFTYPKCFVIMTACRSTFDLTYHTFVIDGIAEFKKRIRGSGFLGTGIFKKMRDGVRHLYHVNAGWNGNNNGFYLYVQNVNDEFDYFKNKKMDYDTNPSYFVVRPK